MEKFTSLVQAARQAGMYCNNWLFANSKESHDLASLTIIASVHDDEYPLDEGDFYLVAQNGAIGQLSGDDLSIDWLFLPPDIWPQNMPSSYSSSTAANYCPQCGHKVQPAANFCTVCGTSLK